MSRSYHKVQNSTAGAHANTKYYRHCARQVRHMNKQMLKNIVPVSEAKELEDRLYHITKRQIYDDWGAPRDYSCPIYGPDFNKFLDYYYTNRVVEHLRKELIFRSKFKKYPLHARKKYSYNELVLTGSPTID